MTAFHPHKPHAYNLWIKWRDGNTATFRSRDWKGRKYDPQNGLRLLLKYINNHRAAIAQARIYDQRGGSNRLRATYGPGKWPGGAEHIGIHT